MIKEKNILIIELLIQSTESGNLIWAESNPNDSRRNYFRVMSATGEDGTKYEVEIKYLLVDDGFILEPHPLLWVRNSNLPNGLYMISNSNSDEKLISSLRKIINEMYCQDFNPTTKTIEDSLDLISKGISVSEYRENKLKKIFKNDK